MGVIDEAIASGETSGERPANEKPPKSPPNSGRSDKKMKTEAGSADAPKPEPQKPKGGGKDAKPSKEA